jgi:hypothetical protein
MGYKIELYIIPIGYILKGLWLPKFSTIKTWESQDFHFWEFKGKAIGMSLT